MTDATARPARPARPEQDPTSPFYRAGERGRFTAREAFVAAVTRPVAQFVRVTLRGADLHDLVSTGVTDHVKLFFPDFATGVHNTPKPVGPTEDGIIRPEGPTIMRDFTPLNVQTTAEGTTVDIDFLMHENPGPASSWAEGAELGDRLVVVGPRGSKGAPRAAERIILLVDGTSLPSAGLWVSRAPAETRIHVLAAVDGDVAWVRDYLAGFTPDREITVDAAGHDHVAALRALSPDAATYVFAAGEASSLIPVRRYLRGESGLTREQFAVDGYWKAGQANFDHHAPIDPADPED